MRKMWGHPEGPPSRADSFVGGAAGYQDSYHSQDTHRSALPITMMMGGGAAQAGAHSVHGSIHAGARGSNPPSVASLHFPPERSMHGLAAAPPRVSSYGVSAVRRRRAPAGGAAAGEHGWPAAPGILAALTPPCLPWLRRMGR